MQQCLSKLPKELKIQSNGGKQENDDDDDDGVEPVSPTGQYLSSKALNSCILAVLESQVPIDDLHVSTQLRHLLLPINARFSSIMVLDKKGVKQWKRVEIKLEDHIKIHIFKDELSIESYDNYLDEYLTKLAMDPLPQDKPLWEFHIFNYPTRNAPAHAIFKLHHALGDGYSLMGSLLSCARRTDNPSLPLTFPIPKTKTNDHVKLKEGCMSLLPTTLCAISETLVDFGASLVIPSWNEDDITPIRNIKEESNLHISTLGLSLDQIKLIKTKLGTTVNDTVSGILFLGIRLYMQGCDMKYSKSRSTAMVMFNTRNIRGYMSVQEMINANTKIWGNKFTYLQIKLPKLIHSKSSNPLDFVYEANKQIARCRNSPKIHLNIKTLEFLRKHKGSEAAAEKIRSKLKQSSMAITNIVGPVQQISLANHPVKGMYFMPTGCPQSLVITIMSYMETLRIGLGIEKGFIDSDKLKSSIHKAFELIYEAATKSS
ncbi:unnamed protein product [Amaranthus hypochondriacus]